MSERRSPRGRSRRAMLQSLPVVSAFACQSGADPQRAAAQAFVDRYCVRQDVAAARELADGDLRRRLDDEARLVGASQTADPPRVTSALVAHRDLSPGRAAYTFDLEVRPAGGASFTRHAEIVVERREASWRVVGLREW